MKVIKQLQGYSNSKLEVIEKDNKLFVRKYGSVSRNIPQLKTISNLGIRVPEIYHIDETFFDMEYILSNDAKSYLLRNRADGLIEFISKLINKLQSTTVGYKDYTEIYVNKLSYIDQEYYQSLLPFTSAELIERLPKLLPQSLYHGDLTLENILFDVSTNEFVVIDAVTIEYDSFVFDLAKLRQDLTCKWFLRKDLIFIDQKLQSILEKTFENYQEYLNDNLVIVMLLRVLLYAPSKSFEEDFIISWIKKLWN